MINFANVVVYNYQYLLDPKVSGIISRELERESIVVFDEAHSIDNVCIEALSVNVRQQTIDGANRNLARLNTTVKPFEAKDAERLKEEYQRLVDGLAQRGNLPARQSASDMRLANPLLPADILQEAMPGNIRHAEHFLAFLRRFLSYLQTRLNTTRVESEGPLAFMHALQAATGIESKSLQLCYDHLQSLVLTLQVAEVDEMGHVQCVCDIATLVGTYTRGFAIIIEPYDERQPQLADPVLQLSTSSPLRPTPHHPPCLQLSCLDASLAIRPTFERFQSVIITRSMLSPIDLYPRLLNSTPSASAPSPCRSRTTASARSSSHVAGKEALPCVGVWEGCRV
ncbi:unnamed protein product [Closterium sp. Naga37s-1]|nr:unnamed protein product [Closterium sp. Naga37s-1]